jgi:methanogenic corrinoid protein MtbC1
MATRLNLGDSKEGMRDEPVKDLLTAMLAGDNDAATAVVIASMRGGTPPADVHWLLVQPALELIGAAWESGLIGVAEEHVATAVCERTLGAIYPALGKDREERGQQLLLAAPEGERHVLGLRAVADVLEGAGFDVLYLGADARVDSITDFAERLRPAAVGLTVAMPGHLPEVIRAATRLRAIEIPVVVGGLAVEALGEVPDVHVAWNGAAALAAFEAAIASAPGRSPDESSDDAARRAGLQSGRTRDAIALQAALLARQEVDLMRAAVRRLR